MLPDDRTFAQAKREERLDLLVGLAVTIHLICLAVVTAWLAWAALG